MQQRPWIIRNLPNLFTASRSAVPFTAWLTYHYLRSGHNGRASAWLVATGLITATDFVDGRLARRLGVVSEFGKQLDPVLDKLVLMAIFGFFAAAVIQADLPIALCLAGGTALAARLGIELRLAIWARKTQKAGEIPGANWNGKVKFCFDCLAAALGWILLIWSGPDRAVISAAIFSAVLLGAVYYGLLSLGDYNRQLAAA